jgi:O-antigen ligase
MLLKSQPRQPAGLAIVFSILAVCLGGLLGWSVTLVPDPLYVWVGVIGLLIFLATLASVELGLLVLIFLTYTRFSDIAIAYHGAPSIARSFVVLLGIAILIRWAIFNERPEGWQRPTVLLGAYGLIGFASMLYAASPQRVEIALSDYIKDAAIAIIVVVLLQRGPPLRRVIWALLAAGIFMGTLSVLQYLTGSFENNFWGFAQAEWMQIVGDTNGYRLSGPVGDPNFYAQTMIVLVPLALERMLNERGWMLRLLAAWALLASILTVIFTFSRGGFIALAVVLVAMLIMIPRRTAYLPFLLIAGVVLLAVLPSGYGERIFTLQDVLAAGDTGLRTEDYALRGRVSENLTAWMMFREHPILGVGWSNFPLLYQEYAQRIGLAPEAEERAAHNLYLEVAAESGLVGLAVFGVLLWVLARSVLMAYRKFTQKGLALYASLSAALGVALLGYLTAAIFIHGAYPRYFWLLVGVILALPQVARNVPAASLAESQDEVTRLA